MNSYLKGRSCLLEQLANYVVKPKSKSKVVILRTNHTSRLWSNFVNQSVKDTGQRLKRGKTDLSEHFSLRDMSETINQGSYELPKHSQNCIQRRSQIVFLFWDKYCCQYIFISRLYFRLIFSLDFECGTWVVVALFSATLNRLVGFAVPQWTSAR